MKWASGTSLTRYADFEDLTTGRWYSAYPLYIAYTVICLSLELDSADPEISSFRRHTAFLTLREPKKWRRGHLYIVYT